MAINCKVYELEEADCLKLRLNQTRIKSILMKYLALADSVRACVTHTYHYTLQALLQYNLRHSTIYLIKQYATYPE